MSRNCRRRISALNLHFFPKLHRWLLLCRTSKLSHAHGGHDSCSLRFKIRLLHSIPLSLARGMTDVGVGSGALFGQRRRKTTSKKLKRGSRWNTSGLRGCSAAKCQIWYAHRSPRKQRRKTADRICRSFKRNEVTARKCRGTAAAESLP